MGLLLVLGVGLGFVGSTVWCMLGGVCSLESSVVSGVAVGVLGVCCTLGVLVAVMSKSALLGLHSWLLDAMEGPTPVSALLHSATLVCAGVVLLGRCVEWVGGWSWLLGVGCWGALWACWLGVWFMDVKRVVALSTMVHVAVMVVGIGCCAGSG